jgi:hypothetical protein
MTASSRDRAEAVPVQKDLLVEPDHQVRRVAPVGHGAGPDPDPVAAPAGRRARRRLDLGRDDLHRPAPFPIFAETAPKIWPHFCAPSPASETISTRVLAHETLDAQVY